MSNTALGNDYVETSIMTWHACARCVAWFGEGEYKYLGKVGCRMPEITDGNRALYKEYLDLGIMRCFRCFVQGQDCSAVPTDEVDDFDTIYTALKCLETGKVRRKINNPAYVEPAAGAPRNAPSVPKTIVQTVDLSAEDMRAKKYDLRDICGPLAKRLSKRYSPYATHLSLHNGVFHENDHPAAARRPSYRKRDRKSVFARNEASKRAEALAVDAELKDMADDDGTPRKKARFGRAYSNKKVENEARRQQIAAEIGKLETERAGLRGSARGKITKTIKDLERARDAIED